MKKTELESKTEFALEIILNNQDGNTKISIGECEEVLYAAENITSWDDSYSNELINIFKNERNRSNKNYIFSGDENNFQSDFNKIKASMERRNAPEEQIKQINEIYERYINNLNFIKFQEL